jgi:geranylgeranyl diphosphate synthase, type I
MVNLPEEKLWDKVNILLSDYGLEALRLSKNYVLQEIVDFEPLNEALRYFFESWFDVLHPTLISLSCEAVGGNRNETLKFGAAVVLLAGAADIHDDIMDKSLTKESNLTVFGKFGQDIAILAGDALLLKGIYLLHEACKILPERAEQDIFDTIRNAFFEMSSGVAREASLRGTKSISLGELMSIVREKVATAEATMRIGAIVGKGSAEEIAILTHFGRTYGILLSLRDEFVDVFEPDEVQNRLANESLPLPILLALQDETKNKSLLDVLKNKNITENIEKILDLSIDCQASKELIEQMKNMVNKETNNLALIKNNNEIFTLLLKSTVEDL